MPGHADFEGNDKAHHLAVSALWALPRSSFSQQPEEGELVAQSLMTDPTTAPPPECAPMALDTHVTGTTEDPGPLTNAPEPLTNEHHWLMIRGPSSSPWAWWR